MYNNVSKETCVILFDVIRRKCDKIFRLSWISEMKGTSGKIEEKRGESFEFVSKKFSLKISKNICI